MKPLHPLERKLLKHLASGELNLEEAAQRAKINLDQTRRALEWLKTKGYAESTVRATELVSLGSNGEKAVEDGLPERILIKIFPKTGVIDLNHLRKTYPLGEDNFSIALGKAKNLGWIQIGSKDGQIIAELLKPNKNTTEETLLKNLKTGSLKIDELNHQFKKSLDILRRRPGYVIVRTDREVFVSATKKGIAALASQPKGKIDVMTADDLTSGKWKNLRLRHIDVEAPPPPIYPGKKHPLQQFCDEVREIFISLGFEEIEGPMIQPSFWNFDALFTPQDHPAREMQDTFYLEGISGKRFASDELIKSVAETHENGGKTGSKGWRGKWKNEKANSSVLRTHTTSVTVRYLANFKPSEAKVFSLGRVFRNEKVSYKHLAEFHQYEGIIVGNDVTLRDLMGLLSKFYEHLGLKKVKFWPTFFPYTEPSIQSMVYYENLGKWVELCGMGIFRPEVTNPLGVDAPVLAWGGGLERLVMLKYGIEDVRQLYRNDLDWIRETTLCL